MPTETLPDLLTGLTLSAILFCLGLIGLLVRRNVIYLLMCVEICTNAAALAFVVAGAHWDSSDGQVMFIFIITLAAAEVAIALALVLQFFRRRHTVDIDQLNGLRG
ncbi:NADH-quinone oxidoreductase subunit NuoK [Microbulbifer thermotolerans]|uniref:NADH-quinone oxidoreductase subunit K n=1 Tax=Microbulbifer thermotolerans TaxID=252514 RepID=A0A143HMY8_MICTH|nr:NADH-quinone oxidoreductase subunit NuoK [Microbulbifer thermotolerans]AMX03068.1 NADH-quinone oxidoreductase subunit K [Microbulbifer thermotolerans]MCX2779036.1 NADH-quinone oxidoreductase subunit NuoK [Microbulbifer thermotolerans]MCX2784227.1 NADH-quinone oxidoreductase subunit NuoK [Microbulbifer thermotolerans]MCX2795692.1 NADH-quinone oxidoreductase subunit NuoK [Microbulbifer thermotolerans]MCX2802066.1 NADH-quinone oxidoreductase subunit NuoK [Microbulbifer thermotolerans]